MAYCNESPGLISLGITIFIKQILWVIFGRPSIRIFRCGITSHFNSLLFFPFSHYIRQSQGIPPPISQDFYFPLTAHSVALPSLPTGLHIKGAVDRYSVRQEKEKKEAPVEVSTEAEHSESTHLPVSCTLKTSAILTEK